MTRAPHSHSLLTRPDRAPVAFDNAGSLARAAFAEYAKAARAFDVARDTLDPVSAIITKADVAPASTGTSGWASQLAESAAADFVSALEPISAAARLTSLGTRIDLAPRRSINFPRADA